MAEAVAAAKAGNYSLAYALLGMVSHWLQDELWHRWRCMRHVHTGNALKSILSLVPGLNVLAEVDFMSVLNDVYDLVEKDQEAEDVTEDLLAEFEEGVGDATVIAEMKAWRR